MNRINSVRSSLVMVIAGLMIWMSSPCVFAGTGDLKLNPSEVHIRETFQGAPVSITATVPLKSLCIIEIKGESHVQKLLRKGRKVGLWMNVGEVEVKGAPSMYLMLTNESGSALKKDLGNDFGYPSLRKTLVFSGQIPKAGSDFLFEQFLKLKESENLYGIFPGAIKVKEAGAENEKVQGDVYLPSNIAPGKYQVTFSVIKDNKLLEQESTELTVVMKGLPKLLLDMALEHALLYGSLAVIIAIVSGFLMGFLFGGKGAH